MVNKKKIIMSVSRFLADPAAWWEQRKYTIALCVIVVILLRVLIILGVIDMRATLVWLTLWAQRLTSPFLF